MEYFLAGRGYQLPGKVHMLLFSDGYVLNNLKGSIRQRFSAAFKWYNALVAATDAQVQNKLEEVRQVSIPQSQLPESPNLGHSIRPNSHEITEGNHHRPSAYLRARCPLCFGGPSLAVPGM
jgi:hypothetical protein